MRTALLTLIIFCNLISGCVSAYKGPLPDLTLTGEQARHEEKRFELIESSLWLQGNDYQMGPEETPYTIVSLLPVIDKVSPTAIQTMSKADPWRTANLIAATLTLSCLAGYWISSNSSTRDAFAVATWLGVGGMLGTSVVWASFISSAAEDYNRDLKQKLTPGLKVGLNFQ